ncbi:hypothetical protein LUZ60_006987 [Juncus effusus]|nr:hypothetical protein LUZ60_006987 [Juncus effusus]
MTMEEEAIDQASSARRERLRALRAAKELLSTPDAGDDPSSNGVKPDENSKNITGGEESEETGDDRLPNMKFRNYLPHDKSLQEGKLPPVQLPKFEEPVLAAPLVPEKVEDPFVNIAPKKPNWDLQRAVQKRLEKLERRTQKALYELSQEQQQEREALEAAEE